MRAFLASPASAWSTGKDSAYALYQVRQAGEFEVVAIFSTISVEYGRVSMHGVREILLDRQAEALGLPVVKIGIPSACSNDVYERESARSG